MTIPTRINGEIIYAEHLNILRSDLDDLSTKTITITEDYTAEGTYRMLVADPELQAINITLPDPSLNQDKNYIIKTLETGATYSLSFDVTIIGSVDNETNLSITENKQSFRLISNGSTWVVV